MSQCDVQRALGSAHADSTPVELHVGLELYTLCSNAILSNVLDMSSSYRYIDLCQKISFASSSTCRRSHAAAAPPLWELPWLRWSAFSRCRPLLVARDTSAESWSRRAPRSSTRGAIDTCAQQCSWASTTWTSCGLVRASPSSPPTARRTSSSSRSAAAGRCAAACPLEARRRATSSRRRHRGACASASSWRLAARGCRHPRGGGETPSGVLGEPVLGEPVLGAPVLG